MNSDQGPTSSGRSKKHLCQALGIQQRLHITRHPQSSGLVERSNRTLKTALRKLVCTSNKDWDPKLHFILMAIRSTMRSHGFTPHQALIGRKMRTPELWWVEGWVPPDSLQPRLKMDEFMSKSLDSVTEIQKCVAHQPKANIQSMDKWLGDNLKTVEWAVGERVMYQFYSETGYVPKVDGSGIHH